MAPTPPPGADMRRGMSLRASLRRVSSRLRQSAGRKCRTAVTPTGARSSGPTVRRSRREYERLESVKSPECGARQVVPILRDTNPFRTYFLADSAVREEEDEKHHYEEIREDVTGGGARRNQQGAATNPYEVVREEVSSRSSQEVIAEEDSSNESNHYEVINENFTSHSVVVEVHDRKNEVLFERNPFGIIRDKFSKRSSEVVVEEESRSYRHHYEVIRENDKSNSDSIEVDRRNDVLYERNPYEIIRVDGKSNEALVEGTTKPHPDAVNIRFDEIKKDSKICRVLGETDLRNNDFVFRNPYEVFRKENKAPVNRYEAFKRDSKRRFSGRFLDGLKKRYELPRNEFEVVRKDKKKKRPVQENLEQKENSKSLYDNPCLQNLANEYEVLRSERKDPCLEHTLVDEYLDRPENQGTLNPAFEDLTLKSNLVLPKSKPPRAPLQEINPPLNDDSFKENCDPNVVVVKRRRKYSVRFEIDEEVEEEIVASRKFGDVLFDEKKRKPSILKNSRFSQEEDNDSTEELLIKNYELLTKGGKLTRADSSTSRFVRRKFGEANSEQFGKEEDKENTPVEEKEEALPLPVVSLYYAPEDRMPSKKRIPACRKKMKNKPSDGMLGPKTSSSDIKVLAISTTDSLNHPSILRTDRLCKIVQKFGPEVLMAMGEDGGDSVLAQFKKSLEKPREAAVVEEVEEEQEEEEQGIEAEPVVRRGKKRKLAEDVYEGGLPMDLLGRSTSRKKLHHIDIHLHALFAAVEHGHVDKARTILESTDVDVNSLNSDGLTPLDVAVLSNNRPLTKVLLAFGAREGNKFGSPEKLLAHLRQLSCEAERRVAELGGGVDEVPRSAPPYTAPATGPGPDKAFALWERRCKGLNKMILGFEQARPPDVPFLVAVDVTGSNSVNVRFQEPEAADSSPCTKFKVEWSTDPDFGTVSGVREVLDVRQTEVSVDGLTHGQCFYFRAACGNIRGYSHLRHSQPDCVIPSSWRDVAGREERLPSEGLALLDRLFTEVRSSRPDLKGLGDQGPGETPVGQRRKKTTIKQLFTAASKFQKHLRRGVFLSCLLYHEDKVLVTNEDFLPVIEVDETYPGSIYNDFHWLLKVACTWDDVKWLRQDMEKSLSSSAVHFRIKLLQAAAQMQTALSIQDLGQLYHKPLRDSEGTVVICTVNYAHSPKAVSVLNSRWLPLGKLSKRAPPSSDANITEILMSTIQEQITYHQVSSIRLPRGLYLSYLKMRSCVDLLQVLVPAKSPNVPPHCKIRDNPHVTAEEWQALVASEKCGEVSEHQRVFVEQVAATARRLFTYMEVSSEESTMHRLYDLEAVEISPEVSLLMVVPPVDSACSVPGQRDLLLQRPDLLPLPVQVFEMVHLGTYRHQVVSRYSRLSCIIELDMALAQHSQREAFSSSELTVAKERLARLEALQVQLNAAWKQCRWLLDVLAFARDRLSHSPTSMRHLLALSPKRSRDQLDNSNGLLQPPDPKAVKSRGSWPGPGSGRLLGTVTAELSRSEQHLSNSGGQASPPPLPPPRPTPPSPPHTEVVRLPPSRSEDTLVTRNAHVRPRTSVSATTSPLLHSRPQYGSGSLHSLSSDDSAAANHSKSEGEEEGATVPAPAPGILQVYAAYDTGLAAGTSLKLHVSPRTSAREVVDLVVKQLNMAVVLKGKDSPIYPADQLANFCLVAVIGARERCLRDDFKPLQLQNPWKKGRLFVRQKHDVLAALEHSSRHSAIL